MPYTYDHPRPALTVDCVLLGRKAGRPRVLLIQRAQAPFADHWALPGGFAEAGETLRAAALRELAEETGIRDVEIEQLHTFGRPGRDPRGWVVSVAFYALIGEEQPPARAASDAKALAWFPLDELPPLAFDHAEILDRAVRQLHDAS